MTTQRAFKNQGNNSIRSLLNSQKCKSERTPFSSSQQQISSLQRSNQSNNVFQRTPSNSFFNINNSQSSGGREGSRKPNKPQNQTFFEDNNANNCQFGSNSYSKENQQFNSNSKSTFEQGNNNNFQQQQYQNQQQPQYYQQPQYLTNPPPPPPPAQHQNPQQFWNPFFPQQWYSSYYPTPQHPPHHLKQQADTKKTQKMIIEQEQESDTSSIMLPVNSQNNNKSNNEQQQQQQLESLIQENSQQLERLDLFDSSQQEGEKQRYTPQKKSIKEQLQGVCTQDTQSNNNTQKKEKLLISQQNDNSKDILDILQDIKQNIQAENGQQQQQLKFQEKIVEKIDILESMVLSQKFFEEFICSKFNENAEEMNKLSKELQFIKGKIITYDTNLYTEGRANQNNSQQLSNSLKDSMNNLKKSIKKIINTNTNNNNQEEEVIVDINFGKNLEQIGEENNILDTNDQDQIEKGIKSMSRIFEKRNLKTQNQIIEEQKKKKKAQKKEKKDEKKKKKK